MIFLKGSNLFIMISEAIWEHNSSSVKIALYILPEKRFTQVTW